MSNRSAKSYRFTDSSDLIWSFAGQCAIPGFPSPFTLGLACSTTPLRRLESHRDGVCFSYEAHGSITILSRQIVYIAGRMARTLGGFCLDR
jgi:hypothetical protein